MNKNQPSNEVLSWVLIGFSFLLFWPLGIFLLIRKLSDSSNQKPAKKSAGSYDLPPEWQVPGKGSEPPKEQKFTQRMTQTPSMNKKSRLALKIVGGILTAVCGLAAIDTLIMMISYPPIYSFEVMELLQQGAICGAGVLMLSKGVSMDRAARRYDTYLVVLKDIPSMAIHQLAGTTGYSDKQVIADLERMISKGYFGGSAYLDRSLGYFFRSRTAAESAAAEKRAAAATPKEAEEGYSGILRDIRDANERIADPELSAKIDRLEEVTAQIFRAIEKDEEKADKVRVFLEYYLPTTQKLLDSYAEFEAAGVDGENLRMAKAKIRETMGNIVCGFENQLDALYAAEAMDIQSDIDVMNNMMQRDSAMCRKDFHVDVENRTGAVGSTATVQQEKK